MDKSYQKTAGLFLLAVVIAAIIAGLAGFSPVSFTANDPGTLGNQLLTLIFIALVIERAVEVFINNQFGADELAARRPIRLLQAQVDMLDEAVRKRAATPVVQPKVGAEALIITSMDQAKDELDKARVQLLNARSVAQPELEDLYIRKRTIAAMLSVVIGLLVATAGVRIFADLVLTGSQTLQTLIPDETQRDLFLTADILITALLLAGGADGIHQILKRFVLIEKDIKG